MATIGSTNLTLVNDRPEVEVLWNGRYRLTFFCDNGNGQTDWYNENKGEIFPAFGALQSVQLGEEGAGDWIAPDGSVYDNMRLVEAGTPFVPSVGKHYVKLVYETLTGAWVQEKDDTTNNDLNGLERVTRVSVALPDTAYTGVIGTTTITKDGTTLYLGKSEVDETDAKWTLTEEWFEHGELSRNEDLEDAKGAISITNLGDCPVAPAGFTAVKTSEDNTQGLPTCTVTFYEDDSELSRSNDYVGSQLAETVEVFNPTVQPTPTNVSAVLGNQVVSSVDGIPTTRYTFLKPSILRLSQELVGGSTRVQVSAFDKTEAQVDAALSEVTENHILVSQREEDYEGIKTSEFVYEISDFEVRNQTESGLQIIQQTELSINNLTDGVIGVTNISDSGSTLYLSSEEIDNGNAIKKRVRKWLEAGTLSVEVSNEAEGILRNTYTFFGAVGTTVGPIVSQKTGDFQGYQTIVVATLTDKDGNPLGESSNPVSEFDQYINFRYPGEVSIATDVDTVNNATTGEVATTWNSHWYSLIPPVTSEINSRVYVFFQTSDQIVASDLVYDGAVGLWNPTEWAKGRVDGLGTNYVLTSIRQTAQDKVFSEYTTVSGGTNSVSGTADYADEGNGAVLLEGSYILPTATYSLTVSGGPGRPDGIKYVVQAPKLTPAFDDVDGNQVWKKVIIVATIPNR